MKKAGSSGLSYVSFFLMVVTSVFLIIWDTFSLVESVRETDIGKISLGVRIAVATVLATGLASLVWGFIEDRKEKSRRLSLRLAGRVVALLLFGLFLYYVHKDTNRNHYAPPGTASYSYEDVRISLPCGDVLAGSLTYSKGAKEGVPAVVLITGSSPHDRDNASPEASRWDYRPFRQIADRLSSHGIAVLRMDHRGVGESIGGDIRDLTTVERAKDIEEGIAYLRRRPEIDGSRIGLIGLSEGVSISHMIASHDPLIKVLVFLSGIGSPGKDVLQYQIRQGVLGEAALAVLLREDKNTRFLFDFDPLITARQIKQPVLIVHGNRDRYVDPNDAYRLEKALTQNGNSNVTLRILEGFNHGLLKEEPDGTLRSARIPDDVLTLISDWVLKEI